MKLFLKREWIQIWTDARFILSLTKRRKWLHCFLVYMLSGRTLMTGLAVRSPPPLGQENEPQIAPDGQASTLRGSSLPSVRECMSSTNLLRLFGQNCYIKCSHLPFCPFWHWARLETIVAFKCYRLTKSPASRLWQVTFIDFPPEM